MFAQTLRSIRQNTLRRTLMAFVLLTLAPMFFLALAIGEQERSFALQNAQMDAQRLTRIVTSTQSQHIENVHQLLTLIANQPALREGDIAACDALFTELAAEYDYYTSFNFTDTQGNIMCSSELLTEDINIAHREWFQDIMQTHHFTVSDYMVGEINNTPLISMAYPVFDMDGEIFGVVSTGLSLEWLSEFAATTALPERSNLTFMDDKGMVLAHYPENEAFKVGEPYPVAAVLESVQRERSGTMQATGVDGNKDFFVFEPISATDSRTYAVIDMNEQAAFANANQIESLNLISLFIVTLVAVLIAWVGSGWIARPVNTLIATTQRIAGGDLSARATLKANSITEIVHLTRNFNDMASALQRHDATLRQSEQRFRAIFNQTFQFVGLLGTHGQIIEFNEAMLNFIGQRPEEVRGKAFWDGGWWDQPDALRDYLKNAVKQAAEGQLVQTELNAIGGYKQQVTLDFSLKPVLDENGQVMMLLAEGRDITERKLAEAALRELYMGMEKKVAERTAELTAMNERLLQEVAERGEMQRRLGLYAKRLKESNVELESFASIASHDLKEPLRKVKAFGDRLQTKYHEQLDDEGRDYIRRMQNATTRMQDLIEDLLVYSRVNRHARPFQSLDLNIILREVLSDLEVQIERTGAQIQAESLPSLNADPTQMRQLLQNLISNALKYRRPDVTPVVNIRVQYLETAPEGVISPAYEILVQDNGIGFEDKYAERIFGIFERLHGRSEYDGTGVGLAICRKIVDRHHGQIIASGVLNEGATFRVILPVQPPQENSLSNLEMSELPVP